MAEAFSLYEALLWEPPNGYFLLEHHMARLARSAAHFRFPFDVDAVRGRLADLAAALPERPRKVRLEVAPDGAIRLEHQEVPPSTPVSTALAEEAVDSSDEFLRHKTSRRAVYERALAAHPEADDVLLWNERRELTETCSANVVVEIDRRRLTPPLSCGLLDGTFRRYLLERGEIEERVLPVDVVEDASRLFLINSVRRWCEILLLDAFEPEVVEVPIEDSFDLHSFAPRDVPVAVEAYLEAAAERGFREVRLIHGKGKGVQRGRVQKLLTHHPGVEEFWDAPPGRGAWGATIVRLR